MSSIDRIFEGFFLKTRQKT